MKTFATLAILATLGLGGCVTQTPVAMTPATTTTDTASFASMAASSNQLEIETSRLALERSSDPDLRRFARQMVRDHGRADQRMMTAMRQAGLPATPPMLSPRHQAKLQSLSATSDAEFDRAYATLQAEAHEEAIALFSAYAQGGDNRRMVAFARETLPTLQMHARHLDRAGRGA